MLFHSSVRKELARSFGATLIVLITVVMTMTLIRTLGQATRGSFAPQDIMLAMGFALLADTPSILSLSLFIAVITTLSRMYRDSEMVIWLGTGFGLLTLLRPLLRFAWPVFLVVAALSLLVLPWSKQRLDDLQQQYEKRGDIDRLEAGQFQESADGQRVFFVEKDAAGKLGGSNVFIATREAGVETITSARSGRIENIGTERFLVLENGQRMDRTIGQSELKISDFSQYRVRVGSDILGSQDTAGVHSRPTWALLQDRSAPHLAELSWRLGLIFGAINLLVLGLAVASANPRVGRSTHLVFALLAFVTYFNLLNLGKIWVASGELSFMALMLGLHGGVLALSALWLTQRHNNWHWPTGRWLSRGRASGARS